VQVGDPFMEKLLVECCLELGTAGLLAAADMLLTLGISAGGGQSRQGAVREINSPVTSRVARTVNVSGSRAVA
jgi:hypothetical protein